MYILNASKYAIENYLTEDIQAVFGIILIYPTLLILLVSVSLEGQFIVTTDDAKIYIDVSENKRICINSN